MLSDQDICSHIEAAFPPYRCVAEIWDYGQKLRFRVFGSHDEPLITMAEVVVSSVRDSSALESLVADVKNRLDGRTPPNIALQRTLRDEPAQCP